MHARQALFECDLFGDDLSKVQPIINIEGSDSLIFDNALEIMVLSGRSLSHAVMMMIPEPWSGHESMSPQKKAFYQYHSCLMEPWDGPASIAFTDGKQIGAVLDRNGLRPSRYTVTKDGLVIMASEAGVLPIEPERVESKGRLQPGQMFLVDMEAGRIIPDEEVKAPIINEHPYQEWLDKNLYFLDQLPSSPQTEEVGKIHADDVVALQQTFGYTFEDLRMLLVPMAANGVEAVGAMGIDTDLAV